MKFIVSLIACLVAFPAFANEKFDRQCRETGLVLNGHALKLALLTTDILLEAAKLPKRKRKRIDKAARAVVVHGGALSDELNFFSVALILRGAKKSVKDKAVTTFLLNSVNDLESYYTSVRLLASKAVSNRRKRNAIFEQIDRGYTGFQIVVHMIMRDLIKIPGKVQKPKGESI